ncbi:MAG: HD domain-containing protein [Planctomycetota bacterium]
MNTSRAFYDPVHGLSMIPTSERGLQATWRDPEKYEAEGLLSVSETLEFTRLHYLRQAGFCFSSHPSATHTRYAHSIGTCHLGRAALDQVDVRVSDGERVRLGEWLASVTSREGRVDLRDEFLLALLLHDIGHYPFSHVLESNYHLRKKGFPNHEEVGVDLILDDVDSPVVKAYDELPEFATASEQGAKRLRTVLKGIGAPGGVNLRALAYLVCKTKREDIGNEIGDDALVSSLALLGHLVSGVVDIDRLDHYIRDLYFTGTSLAVFNVFKLLNSVYLNPGNGRAYVDREALPQAFNLLQAKEYLRRYVFDDPKNMAFNAMLNYCVSGYLQALEVGGLEWTAGGGLEDVGAMLTFTDGQLLGTLSLMVKPAGAARMLELIRAGCPYRLVEKIVLEGYDEKGGLAKLAELCGGGLGLTYVEDSLPRGLFLLEGSKGKVSLLSMKELLFIDEGGVEHPIGEAPDFRSLVRHLSAEAESNGPRCWVFARPDLTTEEAAEMGSRLKGSLGLR